MWRYAYISPYVFIALWLIQLRYRDTFYFFLTTKTVYCSGWFDGVGDESSFPFSSVLFCFIDLPVDVGKVSCKSSTK